MASSELSQVLERAGTLDLRDLVTAARAGDAVVAQVARDLGQRLGRVVAGVVAHANPRRVVVGGPVAAMGSSFLGDLRATVYRLALPSLAEGLEMNLSDPDGPADLIGCASAAMTRWIEHDFRAAMAPSSRQNGHKFAWSRQNLQIPIGNSRGNVVAPHPLP